MEKTRFSQARNTAKHKGISPLTTRQPIRQQQQRFAARSHPRKNHGRRNRMRV